MINKEITNLPNLLLFLVSQYVAPLVQMQKSLLSANAEFANAEFANADLYKLQSVLPYLYKLRLTTCWGMKNLCTQ